jgi:hypothetical protein
MATSFSFGVWGASLSMKVLLTLKAARVCVTRNERKRFSVIMHITTQLLWVNNGSRHDQVNC